MDFDLRFFESGPNQFTPPPAGRHRLPPESNLRLVGFFSKLRFASGRSTESPILRASPRSLVRSRDRIAAVPNALHFNPVFLGSEPKASYSRAPPRAMQQNSPVRDHVTIGILGEVIVNFLLVYRTLSRFTWTLALQGAFAEHQVMLQKLSLKRRVTIVLIRQQEDLDKCDALIIPGGGGPTIVSVAFLPLTSCAIAPQNPPLSRSWRALLVCSNRCGSF